MKMKIASALYCLCIQHRAHTARHCRTTLLILLPTFLSTFLFCISSGVNSGNHHCLVFLLPFCKELFSAFFERHLQRNNFTQGIIYSALNLSTADINPPISSSWRHTGSYYHLPYLTYNP